MTERTFETDDYRVVTGWDQAQRVWVLDIYARQGTALDPDPIFSNRDLRYPLMTVADIGDALRGYGITAPEGFLRDLATDHAQDQHQNADLGTVYRVTYQDGSTIVLTDTEYARELWEHALPERIPGSRMVETQRFDAARWEHDQAGWWVLTGTSQAGNRLVLGDATDPELMTFPHSPIIEASFQQPGRETTTFGQSDESPGEGNTVVSRLEELADTVRDVFSRYRHRDQGMER